jgi:hypothetical protein
VAAAVPRICCRRLPFLPRVFDRRAAEDLGAERHERFACRRRRTLQRFAELFPRLHGLEAGDLYGFGAGGEDRTFRTFLAFVARRHEQLGALRLAVHDQDRARHLDARQVIELIVLPELFGVTGFGCPLDDGDAVADLGHQLGAPLGEFFFRQRVGEDRLRGCGGAREDKRKEEN